MAVIWLDRRPWPSGGCPSAVVGVQRSPSIAEISVGRRGTRGMGGSWEIEVTLGESGAHDRRKRLLYDAPKAFPPRRRPRVALVGDRAVDGTDVLGRAGSRRAPGTPGRRAAPPTTRSAGVGSMTLRPQERPGGRRREHFAGVARGTKSLHSDISVGLLACSTIPR